MSLRVFMQGTTVLCTLPDETEAIGRFVDGRGNKTFLYRGGAGFWLHRKDRDDPTVEMAAKMIGLDDAAVWLVQHGCAVPPDLQKCLRGRVDFDKDGNPAAFGPPSKTKNRRILEPERNALIRAYLDEHGHDRSKCTITAIKRASGVSAGAISRTPLYRLHRAKSAGLTVPKRTEPKYRRLQKWMLEKLGKEDVVDVALEELTYQYLITSARTKAERLAVEALTPKELAVRLQTLFGHVEDQWNDSAERS